MYCSSCGVKIEDSSLKFCPSCGAALKAASSAISGKEPSTNAPKTKESSGVSSKNAFLAIILAIFTGYLGIHRFYVGKTGTGILYLLTCGLCGIGALVDIIMLACGTFKDSEGLPLRFDAV